MQKNTTGWIVTGVGAAVTGVGALVGGSLGAGIAGFGLAHVVLGVLDNFRPTVRR
ncbi:hypothetical protein [Thermanaerosceptrum fracticalcis]|uniref:hypothetical protein n=1 Tax=Thermanaerosceptrum fracticalcis TaxID=1712410 RepID=UPI000B065603|nr:hypothetical protein [Thermanaerosceptrum fracticalcis]